jgi:DNA (cytosine-5)-methyltransferase 1
MEWVLVVPPPLTQRVYQLLVETKCVPRGWHIEGRYGSRTHEHCDSGTGQRMIAIPVLSADHVRNAAIVNSELNVILQSVEEGHGNVHLVYKPFTRSKREHAPPPFDAQIHPERAPSPDRIRFYSSLQNVCPWPPKHNAEVDPPSTFNFAELFAGIGGFGVALEALGGTCIFCSEFEATCRNVYTTNLHVSAQIVHGDIYSVTDEQLPQCGSLDLLVAGFPCQPFSSLGQQPGLSCPKGNLFLEIVRVLQISKPQAFLLENVPGLLQMTESIQVIVEALEKTGYSIAMEICDARGLTATTRKRLYIVGLRRPIHHAGTGHNDSIEEPFQFPYVPDLGFRAADVLDYETLSPEEEMLLRISDEQLHRMNTEKYWKPAHLAWPNTVIDTLVSHYGKSVARGHSQLVAGSALSTALSSNPRRFTPRECARIMGFPSTFILPSKTDPNQCSMAWNKEWYQMFGNAVCPPIIVAIAGAILHRCTNLTQYNERGDWVEWGRTVAVQLAYAAVLPKTILGTSIDEKVDASFTTLLNTASSTETVVDLMFMSEADYPLSLFQLPSSTPDVTMENAATILLSTQLKVSSYHREYWTMPPTVQLSTLGWFFDPYTTVQEWRESSRHLTLPQWQHIRDIFSNEHVFLEVHVFRIGQSTDWGLNGSIDVFVVGRHIASGMLLGLHTISVET